VAKELQTNGTDDVCGWWLVSAYVDFFVRNDGPPRHSSYTLVVNVSRIQIPRQLSTDHVSAP